MSGVVVSTIEQMWKREFRFELEIPFLLDAFLLILCQNYN